MYMLCYVIEPPRLNLSIKIGSISKLHLSTWNIYYIRLHTLSKKQIM